MGKQSEASLTQWVGAGRGKVMVTDFFESLLVAMSVLSGSGRWNLYLGRHIDYTSNFRGGTE